MLSPNAPEFSRNLGFLCEQEQALMNKSTVAIAGAGGDGGMLAIQLARLGVGELRLADPDPFEIENINRQAVCTSKTIGMNKAEVVGNYVQAINPNMSVKVYDKGINEANIEEFTYGAQLVIDETEFTMHSLGVMLARAARKHNIPNLMALNVGFGTSITSFHPRGKTFEEILGLSNTASLQIISEAEVPLKRWLPYVPPYADMAMFKKVAAGEKSAPSIAPGVAIAAGTAAIQAMLHLTADVKNNRPKPVYAPAFIVLDALTGESKVVKRPVISHYTHLAKMVFNNITKKVPKVSY